MKKNHWLPLCILASVLLAPAYSLAGSFPHKYDREIKKASKIWLPGWDWRLWKAQLYQESQLNPDARSSVGASGLAQFMPDSWASITTEMGLEGVTRSMAGPSIQAGAYYMGKLRGEWSSPRPEMDRHDLAAASYNAGLGSILKAQKTCGDLPGYQSIIECLPSVTGAQNAHQTITYVQRIKMWWEMMK